MDVHVFVESVGVAHGVADFEMLDEHRNIVQNLCEDDFHISMSNVNLQIANQICLC